MEIHLNLKTHCIETAIKRTYEQAIRQYFKPDADKFELEERIEILRTALNSLTFSRLRSRYPELSAGSTARVMICTDADRNIFLKFNDNMIAPD
jgi:hypothetical protein